MIFIDESIQHDLDFICVGFVYTPVDIAPDVDRALLGAGLRPGVDEYKSGRRMADLSHLHALREDIGGVALGCKTAVYIAPLSERSHLLEPLATVANAIIRANELPPPQTLLLDEGITGQVRPDPALLNVVCGCDSKLVRGVQVADYVAYHCGYLLKCHMTKKSKPITVEDTPHPLTGETVDLDWLVRTDMRHSFFREYRDLESISGDDWFFKIEGYGAFFSPGLKPEVREAAEATFGHMFLGCIW